MYAAKIVIYRTIIRFVVIAHRRSYHLRNATLDKTFHRLRIFQLFANSNSFTCPQKLRKVSINRMIRKTCQLILSTSAPFRQNYTEQFGSFYSVLPESFIEIPDTK